MIILLIGLQRLKPLHSSTKICPSMNPSRLFILRPVATFQMMLVGLVAYRELLALALPQVDYPTIQVATAHAPTAVFRFIRPPVTYLYLDRLGTCMKQLEHLTHSPSLWERVGERG